MGGGEIKKDNFQFARLMSKKTKKKNQASYKANNQKERTRGKKKSVTNRALRLFQLIV